MAMVNMNNLLNGKDSRWLQLEVCREFQRNKCTRPDTECKFAHPPANVEVQNGRVTACYDSIKVSTQIHRTNNFLHYINMSDGIVEKFAK
ncbi:protein muscleblind isoform X17 [Anoplolepis gracilipes]|uniref:protein muscleblind isoform X17 n=1 Tax=Anoplolepis gracilipes TaxID=354296 RepID=UPI003BA2D633